MLKSEADWLRPTAQGDFRCWWPGDDAPYQKYHDGEWGFPVTDDQKLFEKICLEGFQSGLSWLTILRKRENFRSAFEQFEMQKVAQFSTRDVERLMLDAGIVRHRGKIEATINNAARAIELIEHNGSLAKHVWSFVSENENGRDGVSSHPSGIASTSPSANALSKDLKKRGWKFVGPTTMYSFMQSMGMINDHLSGCFVHDKCSQKREAALKKMSR